MGVNTQALAAKYPYFTPSEIAAFHQQYAAVDKEGRDKVHPSDLSNVATKAGASFQDVTQKLSQLSLVDDTGLVSFEGLLKAVSKVREDKGVGKQTGDKQKIVLHGHGENTTHTINEDEKESFTQHINQALARDQHLKDRLPIDPSSMQIFSECRGKRRRNAVLYIPVDRKMGHIVVKKPPLPDAFHSIRQTVSFSQSSLTILSRAPLTTVS